MPVAQWERTFLLGSQRCPGANGRELKQDPSWAVFSGLWNRSCMSVELCRVWGVGHHGGYPADTELGTTGVTVGAYPLQLFSSVSSLFPAHSGHNHCMPLPVSWSLTRTKPFVSLFHWGSSVLIQSLLSDFLSWAFLSSIILPSLL